MKILFLLTGDLEGPGGAGRYFPLARELVRLGHQVTIAGLHADYTSLQEKRFVRDSVQVVYVAQMHVIKRGNRKTYFSPGKLLLAAARATWALTRFALRTPADIVHICKPHPMNSVAGLAAKILRRRMLFLDCDDHEASSNRYSGSWQRRGVELFENFTPLHVDQVTTHNTFLKKFLLDLGVPPERITYLPNGVDMQRFAAPPAEQVDKLRRELRLEGCPVVGFVGSLSIPAHAIYLLIEAFQIVRGSTPESVLLIVGGGEEFDNLKDTVSRLGLAEAVRFTGRIQPDEVPPYYRLADVLVDPVYDDMTARGRLPLKLFESWISGTPFVSGDVGDRRLVLGEPPAGVLAAPGDAGALAEAIQQVLSDAELAAVLRRRGLERAELYRWERLAQDLDQVYRQHYDARRGAPEKTS